MSTFGRRFGARNSWYGCSRTVESEYVSDNFHSRQLLLERASRNSATGSRGRLKIKEFEGREKGRAIGRSNIATRRRTNTIFRPTNPSLLILPGRPRPPRNLLEKNPLSWPITVGKSSDRYERVRGVRPSERSTFPRLHKRWTFSHRATSSFEPVTNAKVIRTFRVSKSAA